MDVRSFREEPSQLRKQNLHNLHRPVWLFGHFIKRAILIAITGDLMNCTPFARVMSHLQGFSTLVRCVT